MLTLDAGAIDIAGEKILAALLSAKDSGGLVVGLSPQVAEIVVRDAVLSACRKLTGMDFGIRE